LDSLARISHAKYIGFYLSVLKAYFGSRNAFLLYKKLSKDQLNQIYQREIPIILSLIGRLKDIIKLEK